jgi:hypothetical protein
MSINEDTQLIWESYNNPFDKESMLNHAVKMHQKHGAGVDEIKETLMAAAMAGGPDKAHQIAQYLSSDEFTHELKDRLQSLDDEMMHEELDRGDEAGDYIAFLRSMARELVKNDMPEDEAMETVLSHPFEETYGEYIRVRGAAGVYTAAQKHKELAEKSGYYHEVDMTALDNWKYVS